MNNKEKSDCQTFPVEKDYTKSYNGSGANDVRDAAGKGAPTICHTTSDSLARLEVMLSNSVDREKAADVALKVVLDFLGQFQSYPTQETAGQQEFGERAE